MAIELFPERICATCTARTKVEWGCAGKAQLPLGIDGEDEYTCIRRPILDHPHWFGEILTAYRMYKGGFLPNEGTYLAQPVGFLQVIGLIDGILADCATIKEQQEQRKKT